MGLDPKTLKTMFNTIKMMNSMGRTVLLEKISPESEEQSLINAISEANEAELPQYQLLAAKNQKTMGAYNKRRKQLNIS